MPARVIQKHAEKVESLVRKPAKRAPIVIGDVPVAPGNSRYIDLSLPPLYTHTSVSMPVHVIHGKRDGPVLAITAAIHGDEINGIEIIRRLLDIKSLRRLSGTLIAVPVVNVYGFVSQTRYLPDRRDLNRSFPGSERGSMAARLADTLMTEIMDKCTHGIDFHTAAEGRTNLPQIRVDLENNPELLDIARAFAPPIIVDSPTRAGTMRAAVGEKPVLLFEAGEALRFNEQSIRTGVKGVLRVMRHLNMLPKTKNAPDELPDIRLSRDSTWMRASQSGIVRTHVPLGNLVKTGDVLGVIADPFGESEESIISAVDGVMIGQTRLPLVHEGEALYHVASLEA